jgi:hypothetical protein
MVADIEKMELTIPRLQLIKVIIEKEINNALLFQDKIELPEHIENYRVYIETLQEFRYECETEIERLARS